MNNAFSHFTARDTDMIGFVPYGTINVNRVFSVRVVPYPFGCFCLIREQQFENRMGWQVNRALGEFMALRVNRVSLCPSYCVHWAERASQFTVGDYDGEISRIAHLYQSICAIRFGPVSCLGGEFWDLCATINPIQAQCTCIADTCRNRGKFYAHLCCPYGFACSARIQDTKIARKWCYYAVAAEVRPASCRSEERGA